MRLPPFLPTVSHDELVRGIAVELLAVVLASAAALARRRAADGLIGVKPRRTKEVLAVWAPARWHASWIAQPTRRATDGIPETEAYALRGFCRGRAAEPHAVPRSYRTPEPIRRHSRPLELGYGYLTYALLEGLKTRVADTNAADGRVAAPEWLEYATVPGASGSGMQKARAAGRDLAFVEGEESTPTVAERNLQHPRLLYRDESGSAPFIVSQPPK